MRLTKGTKVEVLSKEEVSTGSWLCAEIISGNGHTYKVNYGWLPMTQEMTVERVPRKAIRPCPPPVEGADNWVPGDVVEVFRDLSWKMVTIVKVIDGNNFLVRLLGSSQELEVHKSHLRVRQSWQDGKWIVIGKGSENCTMGRGRTDTRIKLRLTDDYLQVQKNIGIQKPNLISTRKQKRGSTFVLPHVEAYSTAQKKRAIEKDGSHLRVFSGHLSPAFEKVDAFVSPQYILGEKYMPSYFHVGTIGFTELDAGRGNDSFLTRTSVPVDTHSCASSVGSCSVSGNVVHNSPFLSATHLTKDIEYYCSDAESFCGRDYEKEGRSFSTSEELTAEVHRSELHSYHCTIEALYASGPLSWEEEEKVTNLRQSLHISDDEHLMELRNLISADIRLVS